MSLGYLMIDIQGTALDAADREILRHPAVGGVILFARNYSSRDQVRALVADIHALRSPGLLVAVDHEGGRVQRFREGFTALPALKRLGELHDRAPQEALSHAADLGWLMDYADITAAFAPLWRKLDDYYLNKIPGLENPTSENVAVWIWRRLKPRLPLLREIVVAETCQSRCVYRGE